MKKQLFFDDTKLFGRDNVVRKYGQPELVATYSDGVCSTDHCSGYVFRLKSGKYRMLYFAHSTEFSGLKTFAAISDDGVNFSPEEIPNSKTSTDRMFSHEVMTLQSGWEIAYIYEDKYCENCQERYKLFMSELNWDKLCVNDTIYTSCDLLNWRLKEGVYWGNGAEPLASVFYNKQKKVHTIIQRPFWGIRCVGYKETKDWENFSEYQQCLSVDSGDERLAEIYGMYAFEYDGMYIGVPHISTP